MDEIVSGYQIVTIEREFASGGSEVGKLVGSRLGIPVYGREILERVAELGHTTADYIEHLEESGTNSLLYSLLAMGNTAAGQSPTIASTDALNLAEAKIIRELAGHGRCVLVGRCSGWVLRQRKDVLNVFIHAGIDYRLRRAVEVYGIAENQAEGVLKRFDRRRSSFYRSNTGKPWHEQNGYHMMLESGLLGTETCADIIASLVEKSRSAGE